MGEISISAQGAQEYRALAKRLRDKKGLRADLRKKISEAGKPVVEDVKAAVMAIPVTSHGGGSAQRSRHNVARATTARAKKSAARRGSGLRRTIASATKLQVTAKGVRFVVQSSKLPADQRSLPRHLDSPRGWRHQVFGNKSNWVSQKGHPYFADTIKKKAPAFRRAALAAMEEIQKRIEN